MEPEKISGPFLEAPVLRIRIPSQRELQAGRFQEREVYRNAI